MKRLRERAFDLIVRRDTDLIEVGSGYLALGWGLQLLLPWQTFGPTGGYAVMAQVMPEVGWGVLMAWLGVTNIGSYLLEQRRVRLAGAVGSSMVWTFISVAFGVANPSGTGVVVYPFLALLSMLVYWRILTGRERDV